MPKCKWCLQEHEKLAKSHLIPKAFIDSYGGTKSKIYTNDNYPRKLPIGWYDTELKCVKCENEFSSIDDYGARILLKDFNKLIIPFNLPIDESAVQISNNYTQAIKRFLIYTLWKCSKSELLDFGDISLGPYEDKIKNDLLSNKEFAPEEYSFVGQYHTNSIGMTLPFKRKKQDFHGRNYYHLDFNKFSFDIKIDSQSTPPDYDALLKYPNLVFLKFAETPKTKMKNIRRIMNDNESFSNKNRIRKSNR